MEVAEKKNKNKKYKPILEAIPDWPVYQLSKNRKEFIEEVANESFRHIRQTRPTTKQLLDELGSAKESGSSSLKKQTLAN